LRAGIGIHEARNVRVSDCRIHDNGMGIDIEPDFWIGNSPDPQSPELKPYDVDVQPPGGAAQPTWIWFTSIENCQIYDCDKPFTVGTKYSHVVIRGCFIDNSRNHPYGVILSVPHSTVLDSEIDAGTGSLCVGLGDLSPGRVVFTMERCLVRTRSAWVNGVWTTGHGLFLPADQADVGAGIIAPRVIKALIANNRFVNESDAAWFPDGTDSGTRLPNLSHGDSAEQITFRDNAVFIPRAAHHRAAVPPVGDNHMSAVGVHVQLAADNVYETDLDVPDAFFQTQYGAVPGTPARFAVVARNERFLAPGDGRGFRPGDDTNHDNAQAFHLP